VLSGGDIDMSNSDGRIHGDANPGVGKSVKVPSWATPSGFVSGSTTPVTTNPTLATVTVPTVASSNNSGIASAITASGVGSWFTWNSTQKTLVGTSGTLSLSGGVYVLCALHLTGAAKVRFTSVSSTPVRLFFDTPSNCSSASTRQTVSSQCNGTGMATGNFRTPLVLDASGGILTNNSSVVQAYVNGAYTIEFSGDGLGQLGVLYAPQSAVEFCGSGKLFGALAVNTLKMEGGTYIEKATNLGPVDPGGGTGAATYSPGTFVECTAGGALNSTTGC